jgi:tRNA threonylcarbamoyladenosine biosynthesis protein TsaB
VVQGLAFGAGLPVLAVSSLAAVARGFFEQQSTSPQGPALVCMDARMGELYFAVYEDGPGDGVGLQGEEQLLAPGDLRLQAFKSAGTGLTALGSGWQYLPQMLDVTAADFTVINGDVLPRARHIAQLGSLLLQSGDVLEPQQAEPVYLRNQVAWKKSAKALTKTSKTSKGA